MIKSLSKSTCYNREPSCIEERHYSGHQMIQQLASKLQQDLRRSHHGYSSSIKAYFCESDIIQISYNRGDGNAIFLCQS